MRMARIRPNSSDCMRTYFYDQINTGTALGRVLSQDREARIVNTTASPTNDENDIGGQTPRESAFSKQKPKAKPTSNGESSVSKVVVVVEGVSIPDSEKEGLVPALEIRHVGWS